MAAVGGGGLGALIVPPALPKSGPLLGLRGTLLEVNGGD